MKSEKIKQNQVQRNIQHNNSTNPDTTIALENTGMKDLDEQIKSMMTMTDVRGTNGRLLASCNICGKQTKLTHMMDHIEAMHITGLSHACDICGKTSRSRNALAAHKSSYHKDCVAGQKIA